MTHSDARMNRLIDEEWPKLRRFFRTKAPESDVLDIVQNTLLAYVAGGGPGTREKERQYLWGIARKQVLKYYESHRRDGQPFDSSVHTAMDLGPSLSSRLDLRNRLVAVLSSLPVDQQMAVELRYGEGLKLEEVAEALGVSLATVKRYLAAAEERLRAEFGSAETFRVAYGEL
jgi:RNA polymerase sigma-70 factor (ECF subfamily)